MKLKNLRKKIRRLETRLQEGPKKLAKLRRKLEAMAATAAMKAKRKSTRAARPAGKSSTPTQKKGRRFAAKPQVKPTGAKRPSVAKKAKRKLNLSAERRAQLAAAMKARWAAKRAAAEANPQNTLIDRDFTLGQAPQAP